MGIFSRLLLWVVEACARLMSGAGFVLSAVAGTHCSNNVAKSINNKVNDSFNNSLNDTAKQLKQNNSLTSFILFFDLSVLINFMQNRFNRQRQIFTAICTGFILLSGAIYAAPPGTVISNTAEIRFSMNQGDSSVNPTTVIIPTNTVENTIERSPSSLEFLLHNPTTTGTEPLNVTTTLYDSDGTGNFVALAPPLNILGQPIALDTELPLAPTTTLRGGDALFLQLTDADGNADNNAVDTIFVRIEVADTGDLETLVLTETGPSTGVFAGYIQTTSSTGDSTTNNGNLSVSLNSEIMATYTDPGDGLDTSFTLVLVDPYGVVFDSQTGMPVDGTRITMYDADTGEIATVYGDDGVSIYPSTVISGADATDSSGQFYDFPEGFYRFPLMRPGNYYLLIDPPARYVSPSVVNNADLQTITPYQVNIVVGSRGEVFALPVGLPLWIDIPLDPISEGLFVSKSAATQQASIGEFVRYSIVVTNSNQATPTLNASVVDTLPNGLSYQAGSSALNNVAIADPVVNNTGRTLSYSVENLAFGQSATLSYVAYIGAGTKIGEAINTVEASAGIDLVSNLAQASIDVSDPFSRNRSTLIGSVRVSECEMNDTDENGLDIPEDDYTWEGVPGIRFYMEDGTYVVSDEQGMFHFTGVKQGVHVVQMDLDSIPEGFEPVLCGHSNRFSGRAFSQFVDLQNSALWRTDFYLAPIPAKVADVNLQLFAELENNILSYDISLAGGNLNLNKRSVTVMLPEGTEYQAGSASINASTITDPEVMGNILIFKLADVTTNWQESLSFRVSQVEASTELLAKALLSFTTPDGKKQRTPMAEALILPPVAKKDIREETIFTPLFKTFDYELLEQDKTELNAIIARIADSKNSRLQVIGHTDNRQLTLEHQKILPDNMALSRERAKTVALYLASKLDMSPDQISIVGRGATEPRASNLTKEGRKLNRRVDIRLVEDITVLSGSTGKIKDKSKLQSMQVSDAVASLPGKTNTGDLVEQEKQETQFTMPEYGTAWLDTQSSDTELLWPGKDYSPAIPSIKIAIKHAKGNVIKLVLNGEAVSGLNYDGLTKSSNKSVLVSKWNGVDIVEGDNTLNVSIQDAKGKELENFEHKIHYSRPPVRAEWSQKDSSLKADGDSKLVVAVKLFDDEGHPARAGVIGGFSVEAPYTTVQERERLRTDALANVNRQGNRFVVSEDGIAYIELEPSMHTGKAILRFDLANGQEEIEAWVEPGDRDWILVGIGEGTVGYNALSGNLESLSDQNIEDDMYTDGRVAFFAKGKVAGKWLLTMAYDSASENDIKNDALFQTVDPDRYYTLYGDRTEQYHDAASRAKLYLKIERQQFYALFGDYHTGLSVTELSRYNRSFNGFKSELNTERYGFNAFASETGQAFVKDELRGDGTSGAYRLRNSALINSEQVTIEIRDRFRNEIIVEERSLQQHLDYDIDYDAGTIYLREPLFATDFNFNPQFLVIDYETQERDNNGINYGARAALKMLSRKVEIGASVIHEDQGGAEADLQGLDLKVDLSNNTRVRAEVARTDKVRNGLDLQGQAMLAEVAHNSNGLDVKAYYQKQEDGFGLGQQRSSANGSEKLGVDSNYRINNELSVSALAYRETTLATEAQRDIAEARVNYQGKRLNARLGLRQVDDEQLNILNQFEHSRSQQVVAAVETRLLKDRLRLHANQEYNFDNDSQENSRDFPNRTRLGFSFKVTPSVDLLAEQEFEKGDNVERQNTRLGLQTQPWKGAALTTGLSQQFSEDSSRTYATAGLRQALQLSTRWAIDINIDRSQAVKTDDRLPLNPASEPVSGTGEDYTAVSIGNSYRKDDWAMTSRIEWRDSDNEERWGTSLGMLGEPVKGTAVSAKARYGKTENLASGSSQEFDLRLGIAHRPVDSKLTILNRLDYATDKTTSITGVNQDNWSLTNNLNVNYRINVNNQISLMNGIKYQEQSFGELNVDGFTGMLGGEWRYDFSQRFDLGLHGSLLSSTGSNQIENSYGVSVGFNPAVNTWVSLGYNFEGYDNDDFSESTYNAKGVFARFRFKLDQDSLKDLLERD